MIERPKLEVFIIDTAIISYILKLLVNSSSLILF